MNSKLFIVSTPIGNYDDISLRAINTLKEVDFIICEEFKEARRLLSHLKIDKELVSLNEHNEEESSNDIFLRIKNGQSAALISDCGTPLFSDPGSLLVQICINSKIDVVPVPGANSLLPALVGSGFKLDKFYYAGWLSPKSDLRRKELLRLKNIKELIVIMEMIFCPSDNSSSTSALTAPIVILATFPLIRFLALNFMHVLPYLEV